ncbi:MAG: hypothetical protein ACPIOQ_38585, partial [Promethearchaeia archaeon]
ASPSASLLSGSDANEWRGPGDEGLPVACSRMDASRAPLNLRRDPTPEGVVTSSDGSDRIGLPLRWVGDARSFPRARRAPRASFGESREGEDDL